MSNSSGKKADSLEITFGLVKPEAFERGLVAEIERRIRAAGLVIEDKKVVVLTEEQVFALYGHVKTKMPYMYAEMEKYLTSNPVEILKIRGRDAVARLFALRGASNPSDAASGTIRGDYARDQGYDKLGKKLSLNVFHASDTAEDTKKALKLFFGGRMKDWFYSKSTGLYVCRKPLKIDARVKAAAEKSKIKLDWNDEGTVINIDFDDSKNLMDALGSGIMSPVEYWRVLADAKAENDLDMVNELTSDRYTEWLDRVYFFDPKPEKSYIDHPRVVGKHQYEGEKIKSRCPYGGPGWFNPEGNIDPETGEPIRVELQREKFSTTWKYWSPDLGLSVPGRRATAPIRGYITSVGKPSLDLGIPVDSRQPNGMVRECRTTPLEPPVNAELLEEAEKLIRTGDEKAVIDFVRGNGRFFGSRDSQIYKIREKFFDFLGYASLHSNVSDAADELCPVPKKLSYDEFRDFVKDAEDRLKRALVEKKDVTFVMGHMNPDMDTVVSCLSEAYRNHLMDRENTYVPVVQSESLPKEVSALLEELSGHVLFTSDPVYLEAKSSGLARWICVDQNREPEVQKYFVSIIDHHAVSEFARAKDVPKTIEEVGSCAALITLKYLGMGLEIPPKLALLMYGAALMDTENRIEHKMTTKDAEVMDCLKAAAGVKDDRWFYRTLMAQLLENEDAEFLFRRDYKEDWGFSFAVVKIKGGFLRGRLVKEELVSKLRELAAKNNQEKNLPLTLLRITDYRKDNETVNHERIYIVYNNISENFLETVRRTLEAIVRFELPEDKVSSTWCLVDFWGSGRQLSRKKTAPVLEPIVAAFNRYFYSPSIGRWVKRDFLRLTGEVKEKAGVLSTDAQGRVNYVTFAEAKRIAEKVGFGMLSISEYWKVLDDAKRIGDVQMVESLQGSNFLEFWDSAIMEKRILIDHPKLNGGIWGKKEEVFVPAGSPGLMHPDDVDRDTGLPKTVRSPSEYGNPKLWRYWEPDADEVFPCRSYIFQLKQPSWDGKIHLDDSFPNLGIRPVVKKVEEPIVDVEWNESSLTVRLLVEGNQYVYVWPKKASDSSDF